MLPRLRHALPIASLLLLAACGARVEGGATNDCPLPSPGLCPPSLLCTDGHRQNGQATCVGTQWVCGVEACDAGDSGDAGDAASDTGGASDAGDAVTADVGGGDASSCSGSLIPTCNGGHVGAFCCPPGAPCAAPQPFCDLGGGVCVDGDCPADAGCAKGSISASSYDRSCSRDSDCAAVYEGSMCSMCFCPNAALNASALAAYRADFSAKGPGPGVCGCPLIPAPHCTAGLCTLP